MPQARCQFEPVAPPSEPPEKVYGDEVEQKNSEPTPPDRRREEEEAAKRRAEIDDATPVAAAETGPYARMEFGVRSGYAIPFGKATGDADDDLDTVIAGQVPIWLDVGARFRGGLFFGVHASYGFGVLSGDFDRACDQARSAGADVSCDASDVRAGVELLYHAPLGQDFDGWVGGGLGWEWLNLDVREQVQGQAHSLSFRANGMQIFMAQAGVDFEPVPGLGLGPFIALSSDMFFSLSTKCEGDCGTLGPGTSTTIQNKSIHHWLFFGARMTWQP
jgi:hypothetical protein